MVEHLHRSGISPDEAHLFEIYQKQEFPIDAKLFVTPDNQWLFKPDICRSFEKHYKGHIQDNTCSFKDRNGKGSGP
ncbi:MAG: hypothetical protein A2Z95_06330 [Gallionellales bacterium GWA2_60_18]|nr:MAG: hypothetical protein A2Z95_06330 [Gallionellales bacterium GWA2_60_18]